MTLTTDDRRRAQVKPGARRARDRYADLFDFAPIGLLTLDEKGVISRVNLTGGALLGFDPVMLRGSRFARFVQEEDVDRWGRFFPDLVRGGDTESCDLAIWRSDGSPFAGHVDGRFRAFFGPESSCSSRSPTSRSESAPTRRTSGPWPLSQRARSTSAGSSSAFRYRLRWPTRAGRSCTSTISSPGSSATAATTFPRWVPGTAEPTRTTRIAGGRARPGPRGFRRRQGAAGARRPPPVG